MRLLTTIEDEASARTLGDALYAEGIQTTVNPTRDGRFALWVHEESQMTEARDFIEAFDPKETQFSEMARQARAQRRLEAKEARELQARTERMRDQIEARQQMRIGSVTLGLIVVSVFIFMISDFGRNLDTIGLFTFSKFLHGGMFTTPGLQHLATEPWRVVTPIFIHGMHELPMNVVHILFNMWLLKDFGTVVERVLSPLYLLVLVLVIAVVSHFTDYFLLGPHIFGGMSGVVYGLFGFLWIRGRFDPSFPYRMPQSWVVLLMAWFVFGFIGFLPIANTIHAAGLAVGAGWGFLSSGYLKRMLR